jgi:hypothetical protein
MNLPASYEPSFSLSGDGYEGSLPKCADESPLDNGLSLDLELKRVRVVAGADLIYRTVIDAARLDNPGGACGQQLVITTLKERVVAPLGARWHVRQRTKLTAGDLALSTLVISDDHAKPMLISVVGARPVNFDTELSKELTLSVAPAPVCSWGPGESQLGTATLHLSGAANCTVDSNATRCCELWQDSYQVRMHSVALDLHTPSRSVVNFSIIAPGVLQSL